MNRINKFVVFFVMTVGVSLVAFAVDKPMSMRHDKGSMQGMMKGKGNMKGMDGMGKMGGMENMSPEMMDQKMRSMQEHMLKMHDLSNQILGENDAKKKQQLKDEQLNLMKKHMKMMKAMHMNKMQNMHKMN